MSSTAIETLSVSNLERNAFYILLLGPLDDRQRVLEQAEERALHIDPGDCEAARSKLLNPRNRLAAELSWLPGLTSKKAQETARSLASDPLGIALQRGLPDLARANLMAAALELAPDDGTNASTMADFMRTLGETVERFEPQMILTNVNEERAVAGFPVVRDASVVEEELDVLRRHYRKVMKDALDRMRPAKLVETMTLLVERSTASGSKQAPHVIDELVDAYEFEAQSFLQRERESIDVLVNRAREAGPLGAPAVASHLSQIEKVARNWRLIAQPIQLSRKSRGLNDPVSGALGYHLRSLAIDLFNKWDLIDQAQQFNETLRELFAENGQLSDRLNEDKEALKGQREGMSGRKAEEEASRRAMTFSADVGLIAKQTLSISPGGITWKGQHHALDSIRRVRWGATRHSVNGIPTGTDYEIAFASATNSAVVSLRKESTYTSFIPCLWRAVCVRILVDMIKKLKDGETFSFGSMVISDHVAHVPRHKFLGNEMVQLRWSDAHMWNNDGNLIIGSRTETKVRGSASFRNDWNVHVLDYLLGTAFERGVSNGLSGCFDN